MSPSTERHLRRLSVVALCLFAVGISTPGGVASAHAIVDDIVPADGSALADTPGEVTITFSEPILADGISVELTSTEGGAGDPVAALDPFDTSVVVVELPPLADGTHQVRVSARDRADLHEVIARTSFSIGTAPPEPSPPILASPEYPESAARWMFAGGLTLLFGVLAIRTRWPDVIVDRPARLRMLALGAIVTVLVGRLGILAARAASLDADGVSAISTVLGTGDARRFVSVVVALLCVLPLALPLRAAWLDMSLRSAGRLSVRNALGWVGAVWLALLASWGDHSALEGSVEPWTAAAKAGHLIGLGLWIGTLIVVLVTTASALTRRSALQSMGPTAIGGLLLTAGSGLLLTARLVVSPTGLLSTGFGQLLTVKGLFVVAAVGIGLGVRHGWGLRWAVAEVITLGVVVMLGSLMATGGPAIDDAFLRTGEALRADSTAVLADDLLVQVRAIPGLPGPNTLEFRVSDTRRPAPGPIGALSTSIGGRTDDQIELPNDAGFSYLESVELPSGSTPIRVTVGRSGWADAVAELAVVTEPAAYVQPTVLSSAPWAAALRLLAVAVLGAAIVVVIRLFSPASSRSTREEIECDEPSLSS